MIEFYKYLSKIYPNGKANQTCPDVQYERQVFWILYEFQVSPFPPFHDYQKYTRGKNYLNSGERHKLESYERGLMKQMSPV